MFEFQIFAWHDLCSSDPVLQITERRPVGMRFSKREKSSLGLWILVCVTLWRQASLMDKAEPPWTRCASGFFNEPMWRGKKKKPTCRNQCGTATPHRANASASWEGFTTQLYVSRVHSPPSGGEIPQAEDRANMFENMEFRLKMWI